jgi:hypothetical protein
MKAVVALLLTLVVSGAVGSVLPRPAVTPLDWDTLLAARQERPHPEGPDIHLCPTCVSFAGQALNELLNIILNAGVVGGCEDLCHLLEEKIPNELLNVVCNLLCDYVGIKEFIDLIEKADLDPIYYCELLDLCPVNDNGDAHIVSFTVKPNTVDQGSNFHIELLFQTQKGTGTGEIDLGIDTADGIPVGEDELLQSLAPGAYNVTWTVKAKPDPNCDPTQEPCEEWVPGNYTADVAICNGECGSKHPHSQIYDTAKAPFRVVEKN